MLAGALALLMLAAASSGAICQTICASRASMSAMAAPHTHCQEMPAGPAMAAAPTCAPVDGLISPASIASTIVRSDLVVAIAPAWAPDGVTSAPNDLLSARRVTVPSSPPPIDLPPSVLRI
jgi:hypothetical protein